MKYDHNYNDYQIREGLRLSDDGDWGGFVHWLSTFDPYSALARDLYYEARSLADAGDLRGAADRLRLFAYPKWHSVCECKRQYHDTMGKK